MAVNTTKLLPNIRDKDFTDEKQKKNSNSKVQYQIVNGCETVDNTVCTVLVEIKGPPHFAMILNKQDNFHSFEKAQPETRHKSKAVV